RGPNGFEWWMVYFALYNGSPQRSQAIDRVHFLDRRLYVDGPTTERTPGYHPPPAVPTFCDRFDTPSAWCNKWIANGDWQVNDGELVQRSRDGDCDALIQAPPGTHYLAEVGLRFADGDGRIAGMVAWQDGASHAVRVGLDRQAQAWFYESAGQTQQFPLPNFQWDGWHTIRIEKNAERLSVDIDGIPAPGESVFELPEDSAGVPGLFTRNASVRFRGMTYTRGWDEFDAGIRGWNALQGEWAVADDGLHTTAAAHTQTLKGDALPCYEWNVQVIPGKPVDNQQGRAGGYAVWIDDNNWLLTAFNANLTELQVTGKRNGEVLDERVANLGQPATSARNLRVVKLPDRVIVCVDGQERLSCEGAWPPSRVGLFAEDLPCRFSSDMLYERIADE
ncbi:MAG: hypothetical protein QG656_487, partial [Candidatus Hydrogenedentes bacterium]|nr:hypothetical protein [Candidatus Hydrogenedentota bacterium]